MLSDLTNPQTLAMVGINVLLALGLYVMLLTGQLSAGQAGFMAIGAYASSWLNNHHVPLPICVSAAILAAAAVSIPVAVGASRVRGVYLVVGTLAVGELIQIALRHIGAFGRSQGLLVTSGIDNWQIYLAVGAVIVSLLAILRGRAGRTMRAVRDDPDAAAAHGVDVRRVRIGAVVTGAAITGLAGSLYAHNLGVINPDLFSVLRSFDIAVFVLIGGADVLLGPIAGAVTITYLTTGFDVFGEYRLVAIGLFLIVVMILSPEGLLTRRRLRALTRRLGWRESQHVGALARDGPRPAMEAEATTGERGPTVPAGQVVLSARGLTKRYAGVTAVSDVYVDVRRGEVLALIGPNGAGKTTLVNLATGLSRADAGTVTLDGQDITSLPPHTRARRGLARTFQAVRLFGRLTVVENVEVARHGRDAAVETAEPALRELDLVPWATRLPGELPYGVQRRVQLAQALAGRLEVLLLDEPSTGLDPEERTALLRVIQRCRANGMGVMVVDHDLDLVMSVADRVVVLDFGEVIAEGTPEEVLRNPDVQSAYLGALTERETPAHGLALVSDARSGTTHRATEEDRPPGEGLVVDGLVVRYGPVEVLHGVSLRVDPGETVALLGRNGAGKTTLLRTLFGYLRPRAGSASLGGTDLLHHPAARMLQAGVAYVPEDRGIFRELTVLENLRLAAARVGRSASAVEETFDRFPMLAARRSEQAGVLSGGQQQLLAIGRSLLGRPKLLLLDEPSLGLAPKVQDEVFDVLEGLAREGTAVLLVEQNARRARGIADRVYALRLGHVVLDGEPAATLDDERLRAAYLDPVDPDR
jgi:ABC-type branched-subunit amino acid transport system ATPase component/ABC-type branched-subunit amino acid transport system permease subunit